MAITKVAELPSRGGGRSPGSESYIAKDIRAFLRHDDWDVAVVECEGHTPKNIVTTAKSYIKAHPEQCAGINAVLRKGKAYLYRL